MSGEVGCDALIRLVDCSGCPEIEGQSDGVSTFPDSEVRIEARDGGQRVPGQPKPTVESELHVWSVSGCFRNVEPEGSVEREGTREIVGDDSDEIESRRDGHGISPVSGREVIGECVTMI